MRILILFAVAALAASSQLYRGSAQTSATTAKRPPPLDSTVNDVRIVPASELPSNPDRAPVDEYCSSYVIDKPTSRGGKSVARNGWHVTSETKLGTFDAVTFVGGLRPATSGTCFHTEGNLAAFDGAKLVAIAYLKPSSNHPPSRGDDDIEDSLGSAAQVAPQRIRLSHGLPSAPFADVVTRDGIHVEPIAGQDRVCRGQAIVPNIYGRNIRKARTILAAKGWRPLRSPEEALSGREKALRKAGVIEVEYCSGTGYGFCAFSYQHTTGIRLGVTSAGDEPNVINYEADCSPKKR